MRTGVLTLLAVITVGTSLLVPTVSRATIMERVSIAQLSHQADAIVVGRVQSSGVRLAMRGQGLKPQAVATRLVPRAAPAMATAPPA